MAVALPGRVLGFVVSLEINGWLIDVVSCVVVCWACRHGLPFIGCWEIFACSHVRTCYGFLRFLHVPTSYFALD